MNIFCKHDELVNPKLLKPNPENPNEHTPEQARRLLKLFEFHGIRHPIIVSKQSGYIVVGHGRHMAALMGEMESFPVVYQDFESSDQEYAFMVADNGSADWAELDLAAINAKLPDLELPDVDVLGIPDFELDPTEKPPKTKAPKFCPHCGEDVNQSPV